MNTTYKYLLLLFVLLPETLWAQSVNALKLLNTCKEEIKEQYGGKNPQLNPGLIDNIFNGFGIFFCIHRNEIQSF